MNRECRFLNATGEKTSPPGKCLPDTDVQWWHGLPVELQSLEPPGISDAVCAAFPTIAMYVSGHGFRDASYRGATVRVPFRPGVLTLQDAEVEVRGIAFSGRADEIVVLQMPPDVVSSLLPEERPLSLRTVAPFEDDVLAGLMMTIRDELRRGCTSGKMYSQGLSLALLGYLRARYADSSPSLRVNGKLSHSDLARIREYVEANMQCDLGIDEIARVLNLSASHFNRLFRNTTGQSPYRFIQQERIDRAIALMRGCEPLAEIAHMVGFSSQSHFTQAFRQLTGSTPARARAELLDRATGPLLQPSC